MQGARTPGFYSSSGVGVRSGGLEQGVLGAKLPGFILFLEAKWELLVRAGSGLGARTPGFYPQVCEESGAWWREGWEG